MRWTGDLLERLTVTALLRYLAVAHFGRGRGEWAEGEHPLFWHSVAADAVAGRQDELARMLKASIGDGGSTSVKSQDLTRLLTKIGWTILARLYPEAVQAGKSGG